METNMKILSISALFLAIIFSVPALAQENATANNPQAQQAQPQWGMNAQRPNQWGQRYNNPWNAPMQPWGMRGMQGNQEGMQGMQGMQGNQEGMQGMQSNDDPWNMRPMRNFERPNMEAMPHPRMFRQKNCAGKMQRHQQMNQKLDRIIELLEQINKR